MGKTLRRKRKARGRWILAGAILAAALGGGWWYRAHRNEEGAEAAATAEVVRRDFASTVLATGSVQAQVGAEVRVGARISGRVEELHANIGDRVHRGDVIAELEKADLVATVAQRQAEVETAQARLASLETLLPLEIDKTEAELAQWQANLDYAEGELARQRRLSERGVATEQEIEQAREQHGVAAARRDSARKARELAQARNIHEPSQARAELDRARAALHHAEAQLAYATIRAPIDGVVADVSTQEGETVAAGLAAPTFVTIIDLDRLQVDAFVDEVDIGRIRLGQETSFTVDAFPGREFPGRVTAVYPKAVIQDNVVNYVAVIEILGFSPETLPRDGTPLAQAGSGEARLVSAGQDSGGSGSTASPAYDEPQAVLRPEMTASVTIFMEERPGRLAVPARAVRRERGRNVVYRLAGGNTEAREVHVGLRDGQWIEIASGLEEGDVVLLEAPHSASPG